MSGYNSCMRLIKFFAEVVRDTTPLGATRTKWVGSSLRGRPVSYRESQTFIPGVSRLVRTQEELEAYPDSAGSAEVFRADSGEIVASITVHAVDQYEVTLYGEYCGLDASGSGLIEHLVRIRYKWICDDIVQAAKRAGVSFETEVQALRSEMGLT